MKSMLFTGLLSLSLVLAACGGNDPNDPGNRLTGVLSGQVQLQDENGTPIANNSGAVITMEGTSYSTTSDADGHYQFDALPAGTYVMAVTKDGFTTDKRFGVKFVGGGTDYAADVPIMKLPRYTIENLHVQRGDSISYPTKTHNFSAIGTLTPASAKHPSNTVQFYLGRDASVSKEPGKFVGMIEARVNQQSEGHAPPPTADFQYLITTRLAEMGFAVGEEVFVVAYPCAPGTGVYYDPMQRSTIDTRVVDNPSNVTSFVWQ